MIEKSVDTRMMTNTKQFGHVTISLEYRTNKQIAATFVNDTKKHAALEYKVESRKSSGINSVKKEDRLVKAEKIA